MTSSVDTSVKWARSTMPGAPVLRAQAGSLISLLDAVLVDGWGLQSATSVTVAGGTATAIFPIDHAAAVDAVVLVAGATPAELNGEQKVTAVAPNTIKWATALPDGAATGTITVKMAPAGYNKVFAGTNLAAYKSAHPQAHGQFLRVNDASATVARVVGYENMSGVSTGTGPFPTNAQVSGGYYWAKSDQAGAAAVPWSIASDGRAFFLDMSALVPTNPGYIVGGGLFFGDVLPESEASAPFDTLLTGAPVDYWFSATMYVSMGGQQGSDHGAMPRAHTGVGAAIRPKIRFYDAVELGGLPNPINGRVIFSSVVIQDAADSRGYRAFVPGVVFSRNYGLETVFAQRSVFTDRGGRSRLLNYSAANLTAATSLYGAAIDITGPWR